MRYWIATLMNAKGHAREISHLVGDTREDAIKCAKAVLASNCNIASWNEGYKETWGTDPAAWAVTNVKEMTW